MSSETAPALKLYFGPGACSFVPHCLLQASQAAFEPMLVKLHKGEHKTPEYLSLNPRGQVPVLVDGERVITQIVAICLHLDQRFAAAGFFPREPLARARTLELLAWMNNTVHPIFTHIFMPQKFTSDVQAQAAVKAHNLGLYNNALAELDKLAATTQQAGRQFVNEDNRFGPLDAYMLTLARWGTVAGLDPAPHTALWQQVKRVAEHPPVAQVLARERIELNMYKPPQ